MADGSPDRGARALRRGHPVKILIAVRQAEDLAQLSDDDWYRTANMPYLELANLVNLTGLVNRSLGTTYRVEEVQDLPASCCTR